MHIPKISQNCFLKLENEVLSHPIQLAGTLLSETQKTQNGDSNRGSTSDLMELATHEKWGPKKDPPRNAVKHCDLVNKHELKHADSTNTNDRYWWYKVFVHGCEVTRGFICSRTFSLKSLLSL